jgi:hypothetical protein
MALVVVPIGWWRSGRMTSILPRSRVLILTFATGVRVVRAGGLDDCDSGGGGRRLLASD